MQAMKVNRPLNWLMKKGILAGRQTKQRQAVFLGHELRHNACRTGQLSALSRVELHVVNKGTGRDIGQR